MIDKAMIDELLGYEVTVSETTTAVLHTDPECGFVLHVTTGEIQKRLFMENGMLAYTTNEQQFEVPYDIHDHYCAGRNLLGDITQAYIRDMGLAHNAGWTPEQRTQIGRIRVQHNHQLGTFRADEALFWVQVADDLEVERIIWNGKDGFTGSRLYYGYPPGTEDERQLGWSNMSDPSIWSAFSDFGIAFFKTLMYQTV